MRLLLTRSDSDSSCMAVLILSGGLMSLISYRMQSMPHFWLACCSAVFTDSFKLDRSWKVLSRLSLPISLRMEVYARRDKA